MKYLKEFKLYTGTHSTANDCSRQYDTSENEFNEKGYTDDDWNNIVNILERDCKPFLDELVEYEIDPIWRGSINMDDTGHTGIWLKSSRSNRLPKDMDDRVSGIFDDAFMHMFGFKLRSQGVFASKNPSDAATYGKLINTSKRPRYQGHLFFPIGSYSVFWNKKIQDLFSDIENEYWYTGDNNNLIFDEWNLEYGDPRYVRWGDNKRQGYYTLNGVELEEIEPNAVKKEIFENPSKFGLTSNNMGGLIDKNGVLFLHENSILSHISQLLWIPDVSFDDYANRVSNYDSALKSNIDEIVSGYIEGDLKDVGKHEITFICDKYYLVDESFYPKLLKYIKSKGQK